VCHARPGATRSVGGSTEKIDGDRPAWGSIEEAEYSAFLTELLKAQSLR
jgi:hypothetical protein